MKNKILLPFLPVLIVGLIFSSCEKDKTAPASAPSQTLVATYKTNLDSLSCWIMYACGDSYVFFTLTGSVVIEISNNQYGDTICMLRYLKGNTYTQTSEESYGYSDQYSYFKGQLNTDIYSNSFYHLYNDSVVISCTAFETDTKSNFPSCNFPFCLKNFQSVDSAHFTAEYWNPIQGDPYTPCNYTLQFAKQ